MSTTTDTPRLPRPVQGMPPPRARRTRLGGQLALLRHPGCVAGYLQGKAFRRRYAARLRPGPVAVGSPTAIDVAVCSFSSERDLPEQVASIASFLRHAGRPASWTVISDGSHTAASKAILRSADPCVRVTDWTAVVASDLPAPVRVAVERHPLGKKLALLMSLPVDGPTLMVDSDVLFFAGARGLAADLRARPGVPRYQQDCFNVLDERLVPPGGAMPPTNTGFLVLPDRLDWRRAVQAVQPLASAPDFFAADAAWVEQGMAHLALCDAAAEPMDPARYVISGEDHLRYREHSGREGWVMRHYAGPTRYMFWVRLMNDALVAGPRPHR